MKHELRTWLAAALLMGTVTAGAQEALKWPAAAPAQLPDGSAQQVSATTNAGFDIERLTDPMMPMADKLAVKGYADSHDGAMPATENRAAAQVEGTVYNYRGINTAAGQTEDGSRVFPGFVDYNLFDADGNLAFECDTVAASDNYSPYGIVIGRTLYSWLIMNSAATKLRMNVYDSETLQLQRTVNFDANDQSAVPFVTTYDEVNHLAYAISMGVTQNQRQPYYLNVIDTVSGKLLRLGEVCHYDGNDAKKSFVTRGLIAHGGKLYMTVSNRGNNEETVWMTEINPVTCEVRYINKLNIDVRYVMDAHPMYYDPNLDVVLMNYYDMEQGTRYFKVNLSESESTVDLIGKIPTGYKLFYRKPSTLIKKGETLAEPADYSVTSNDEGTELTIHLTVPTATTEGTAVNDAAGATVNIILNQETVNTIEAAYGQELTVKVPVTPFLYFTTAQILPKQAGLNGCSASSTIVAGPDAPAAVSNLKVTLNKAGTAATLTWTVPTTGRFADFGGTFDRTALVTFDVVRNPDSVVVAKGISVRRAQDTTLPEEMGSYDYTVYPYANGLQGAPATSSSITAGNYMALPYINTFDDIYSMLGWTVINANNDGTSMLWQWNQYSRSLRSAGTANRKIRNDDWAITPPFRLKADKLYELQFEVSGEHEMELTFGTGNTVATQQEVVDLLHFDNYVQDRRHSIFKRPAEDGTYLFGFRDISYGVESVFAIDNVKVNEVASITAPAAVEGLAMQRDAQGELKATLTMTAPTANINGDALTGALKVSVYDLNGQLLGQDDGVQPGANVQLTVNALQGWNQVRVVAENENGEGWPVEIRGFVGNDVPVMAKPRLTWGEDINSVVLSWDEPSNVGKEGGYVDASKVKYTIWQPTGSGSQYVAIADDVTDREIEIEIQNATAAQTQYVFAVTAKNDMGESNYARVGVVQGKAYKLPYAEPWKASGTSYSLYITDNTATGSWVLDGDLFNESVKAQNNDGCAPLMLNNGEGPAKASFHTPILDLTNAQNPVFSLWAYNMPGLKQAPRLTLDVSIDGNHFVAASDTVTLDMGNGWSEYLFNLKEFCGNRVIVGVTGLSPDAVARIWCDNWRLAEATGKDLAITAISQPFMPVNGQKADISVTVTNKGAEPASDYSILFNLNGEAIAEEMPEKTLESGQSVTVNFPLAISPTLDEVFYSAEVLFDGDENEDNNLSAEVELRPEQIDLPAPTALAAEGESLVWQAPEAMDGRTVTLDFENLAVFDISEDIAGWRNLDLDKDPTSYFLQYYDNYWPHVNQPFAFMTWNVAQAGNGAAAMWAGRGQGNSLIHFGSYGIDNDGHAISGTDDWFISPEIKGGTEFSFWSKSNDMTSVIDVMVSTTDREPASFTNRVAQATFSNTATWYEKKIMLPTDAKYVALHITQDGFGIVIDDMQYTLAEAPRLQGYRLYNGNEMTAETTETRANNSGNGTYRVTALYDLGESVPSEPLTFSAIRDINDEQSVETMRYNAAGQRVSRTQRGLSIIRMSNGKTRKVVVK